VGSAASSTRQRMRFSLLSFVNSLGKDFECIARRGRFATGQCGLRADSVAMNPAFRGKAGRHCPVAAIYGANCFGRAADREAPDRQRSFRMHGVDSIPPHFGARETFDSAPLSRSNNAHGQEASLGVVDKSCK